MCSPPRIYTPLGWGRKHPARLIHSFCRCPLACTLLFAHAALHNGLFFCCGEGRSLWAPDFGQFIHSYWGIWWSDLTTTLIPSTRFPDCFSASNMMLYYCPRYSCVLLQQNNRKICLSFHQEKTCFFCSHITKQNTAELPSSLISKLAEGDSVGWGVLLVQPSRNPDIPLRETRMSSLIRVQREALES